MNKSKIEQALSLLGSLLEQSNSTHWGLVVCGGSSLILRGFVSRVTNDVDILALVDDHFPSKIILNNPTPLAKPLQKAAWRVAEDLGLDHNWLNTGPSGLLKFGLPSGLEDRLESKTFGKTLTVYFIGRLDQIHFKVYAAVDSGPGRHVDDMLALKPTEEEMSMAAKWALTQDSSDGFKYVLKEMLEKLGYENTARNL